MTFQPGPAQFLEKIPLIKENEKGQRRSDLLGAKGEHAGEYATSKQCPLFPLLLCQAGLSVKQKGQDIEHRCHAVHPLDNIGDRLGLNRMNEPDKGSHQWDPSPGCIFSTQRWDAQGCFHKKVEQDAGGNVDQDID